LVWTLPFWYMKKNRQRIIIKRLVDVSWRYNFMINNKSILNLLYIYTYSIYFQIIPSVPETIIQHIRNIRIVKGYSQSYMAHQLGISQKTYSCLESGATKLSIDRLERLAEIFDTSIDHILHFDQEKPILFDMEKLIALYEQLLKEKETIIHTQRKMIQILESKRP